MIVWRLARLAHAKLDGEGARLAGGRWNSRGRAAVYASSRLSLAALELLVHTDVPLVPPDLVAFEIAIPDTLEIESVDLASLPEDWRLPGHRSCRSIGDTWLAEERTAVLRVPSAVVPEELNYIINPAHRAAKSIQVVGRRKFAFDSRLLG
ncbi:MAG TPA: RES family NAD+ phosphorylase [Gemmatimonadaceae bacterium]|jgi:RES domain-containing protein